MIANRFSVATCVVAALATLSAMSAANAASFTNGDFETPIIAVSTAPYSDGSTDITGWTVSAPGGNVAIISPGADAHYPAESGSQWIDLTGTFGKSQGLTQAFDTVAGHAYSVTFGIGAVQQFDDSGTSIIIPYINNVLVPGLFEHIELGSTVTWQDASFNFNATGASTTLGLFNGIVGTYVNGLDDVRISDLGAIGGATPLPGALPLFAGGLGVIGLLARRRRKSAAL